jgi:hypothetical protein
MSIEAALTSTKVQPGHELYLRGGVYEVDSNFINATIAGSEGQQSTVRNYPGEIAYLRFGVYQQGAHVRWMSSDYGLVFQSIVTDREFTSAPHAGIDIQADDVDLINIRYDNVLSTAITAHNNARRRYLYGNIIFNNGYVNSSTQNLHGPGIYTSNEDDAIDITIENTIVLNSFRNAFQIGSGNGLDEAHNFTIKDVITAGPGFYSGSSPVDDLLIDRLWSLIFHPRIGIDESTSGSMEMRNSLIDSSAWPYGTPLAFQIENYLSVNVHDNEFTTDNYSLVERDGGTYNIQSITPVTGQHTLVIPNIYAPGFATIAVFDFDDTGSVAVDVSALASSGTLRLRNLMLWSEYVDLPINNGEITIDMTIWTTPAPNGFEEPLQIVFSARFGVWIAKLL